MTHPVFSSERLDFWRPVASDFEALQALLAPEAVRRFLGNRPVDPVDEFQRFLRNAGSWSLYGYGNFLVRRRGEDTLIGLVGVFRSLRPVQTGIDGPEVGWIIGEPFWGQGMASEAAAASLAWFDRNHGIQPIACMIDADNLASLAVAEKLGFVRHGATELDGTAVVLLRREGPR